jgi:ATP-dependent DNA helicase RecQ
VPPYVIFHDSTLEEMIQHRPTTLDGLLEISGVGVTKLDRYGAQFLNVLLEAANQNPT